MSEKRHCKRWSKTEDEALLLKIASAAPGDVFKLIPEIAKDHDRTENAIKLRILGHAAQQYDVGGTLSEVAAKFRLPEASLLAYLKRNPGLRPIPVVTPTFLTGAAASLATLPLSLPSVHLPPAGFKYIGRLLVPVHVPDDISQEELAKYASAQINQKIDLAPVSPQNPEVKQEEDTAVILQRLLQQVNNNLQQGLQLFQLGIQQLASIKAMLEEDDVETPEQKSQ